MPDHDGRRILIDVDEQRLQLFDGRHLAGQWPVSTATSGTGERNGSACTPRGAHRVRLKIGEGCDAGTVFVGRRPTGECYTSSLAAAAPDRDWILTRILWLTGCERGFNRGGDCDSLRRFIYIHGCPDTAPIGRPGSHGCIRMRNDDVVQLFDQVEKGCPVFIRSATMGR